MSVELRPLIGKLNESTRSALEAAAGLCLSRTHYDVEIEHFLLKYFEIDRARLSAELNGSLDKLKSGNARTPAFSPTLVRMLTEAWTIGSINYGARQIRSGFAVLALASEAELSRLMREVSREFQKINRETLGEHFADLTRDSVEATEAALAPAAAEAGGPIGGGKTPYLDQY